MIKGLLTRADSKAPDQPVHQCSLIRKLHCLLIGQRDPICFCAFARVAKSPMFDVCVLVLVNFFNSDKYSYICDKFLYNSSLVNKILEKVMERQLVLGK